MICKCGRENAARRRYCGDCGEPLCRVCTQCGFDNQLVDRYCGGCGGQLQRTGHRDIPLRTRPAPSPPKRTAAKPVRPPLVSLAPEAEDEIEVIDADELESLLAGSTVAPGDMNLPDGRVTQDDLDRLFEGGS